MRGLLSRTFGALSFRGRLLTLLLVVSLIQAGVAALTFHSLQVKPIEQRINAQLGASVRAAAPLAQGELQRASEMMRTIIADPTFITALEARDTTTLDQLMDGSALTDGAAKVATPVDEGAGDPVVTDVGDEDSKSDEARGLPLSAYVTDANGDVIAGKKPAGPTLEREGTNVSGLRRGAELIGVLHVPVPLGTSFIESAKRYAPKGVAVLTVADGKMATAKSNDKKAPSGVHPGLQEIMIDGKRQLVLFQPLTVDEEVLVGAAIPTKVVAAERRQSMGSLVVFILAMVGLMAFVSVLITRSVGDALRRFAQITTQLASGKLDKRVPVVGKDEVAILSSSFNDMADALQMRMQNIEEARLRMRRQMDLFGDALANATDISEMLQAVLALAVESTAGTHARFWTIDEEGHFVHSACIGLRPEDTTPCELERAVTVRGCTVINADAPYWMVVPARMSDRIVGLLTIVSLDTPFDDDDARMAERLGVQAAVAIDNALLHEQLRDQATRDGLTGLPNHRTLQDTLSNMLEESNRKRTPLGVVLLDIDNFKRVNDTYGHPTGDEALKAIGRVLEHGIGAMGMAGRFGGEEFVLLVPDLDVNAVARIADRLREDITKIEIPLETGGTLKITSSFGVANVDQNPGAITSTELLHQADVGMYNAKRTGKNRVVIAGPETAAVEMTEADIAALAARERGESPVQFPQAGNAVLASTPIQPTLLSRDQVPELADGEDDFFSDAA